MRTVDIEDLIKYKQQKKNYTGFSLMWQIFPVTMIFITCISFIRIKV